MGLGVAAFAGYFASCRTWPLGLAWIAAGPAVVRRLAPDRGAR